MKLALRRHQSTVGKPHEKRLTRKWDCSGGDDFVKVWDVNTEIKCFENRSKKLYSKNVEDPLK